MGDMLGHESATPTAARLEQLLFFDTVTVSSFWVRTGVLTWFRARFFHIEKVANNDDLLVYLGNVRSRALLSKHVLFNFLHPLRCREKRTRTPKNDVYSTSM